MVTRPQVACLGKKCFEDVLRHMHTRIHTCTTCKLVPLYHRQRPNCPAPILLVSSVYPLECACYARSCRGWLVLAAFTSPYKQLALQTSSASAGNPWIRHPGVPAGPLPHRQRGRHKPHPGTPLHSSPIRRGKVKAPPPPAAAPSQAPGEELRGSSLLGGGSGVQPPPQ